MTGRRELIPFLKWAGGKRWLFTSDFIKKLPKFERYIEPFLGGGAGFFAINPTQAILADVNPELIGLYRVIRDTPEALMVLLEQHQKRHSRDHYYDVRSEVPQDAIERAARTLYLNRTCWNGLYRMNRNGMFNVPQGTKSAVILPTDDFRATSERLSRADLRVSDFEAVLDDARFGDFVFVDPPYTVRHNMNGFVKYNEKIFSWADQVRLATAVVAASERGASILVTNADHDSVRDLYADVGGLEVAERASVISGKSAGRVRTSELIVRL